MIKRPGGEGRYYHGYETAHFCFPGRILFYRNLQTFRLGCKLFSVLIFMLSEMFSEETV